MNEIMISGTVRTLDAVALGGVTLTLISPQGRQLGRTYTGREGDFALAAPHAGPYVLIAATDGYRPQATALIAGGEQAFHDIVLLGAGGLGGVVRAGTDGAGVPGAMVIVTDSSGEVLATAKTAENGAFAVEELPDGLFTVAVNAAGFRPAAVPVEVGGRETGRVEISLSSGAHLQGTVRSGSDRRPMRDARVTLVDVSGEVVATATTGEDGRYAFTDLKVGDYTLIASGYPPAATPLVLSGRGEGGYDVKLGHPDE